MKRDLNEIAAFLDVAREGGFTAASERSGLPKSYLSRKVADLEARLELRLLNRTTRSVSLTEDGQRYYEACEKAYSEIESAEADLEESLDNPSGHLRVTCPVEFGPIIAEKFCRQFLNRYPNITLEIFPSNSIVDLVRDQFDVAIRPSHLAQQDMIAINLGKFDWGIFASPVWKRSNTGVKKLEDLQDRLLLAFNPSGKYQKNWKLGFKKGKEKISLNFEPRFVAGNFATLIEATKQGTGAAALPTYLIQNELKNKELVPLFKDWMQREEGIYALYSSRQHMSSRMRVFLDYLKSANLFAI